MNRVSYLLLLPCISASAAFLLVFLQSNNTTKPESNTRLAPITKFTNREFTTIEDL